MVGFLEGQKSASALWHMPPPSTALVLGSSRGPGQQVDHRWDAVQQFAPPQADGPVPVRRLGMGADPATREFNRRVYAAERAMEKSGTSGLFVHQIMSRLNHTFNGASEEYYHDATKQIQRVYRGKRQRTATDFGQLTRGPAAFPDPGLSRGPVASRSSVVSRGFAVN